MDVYISFDESVLGWIETCYLEEGGECFTVDLQKGVDYRFYRDSKYSVQFLFENDSPDEKDINFIYLQTFQLALSSLAMSAATLATVVALL